MRAENLSTSRSRRVVAAARLLLSDKPGEVEAAIHAINRLLPDGTTVADLIEKAVASSPPTPTAWPIAPSFTSSWQRRARMARACPHLSRWEREFLRDICERSSLSGKQEGCLKRVLAKAEEAQQ